VTVGGGQLLCWGANNHGQIGNGTSGSNTDQPSPTTLPIESVTSVDAGGDFTCAVYSAGLYCWGGNATGQLGTSPEPAAVCDNETISCALSPVPVVTGPNNLTVLDAVQVSAGETHACAVTSGSAVICWGAGTFGQTGRTVTTTAVDTVATVGTPTQVSAGTLHTCVARGTSAPLCWGYNRKGQLGVTSNLGTANPNPNPSPVSRYSDDERLNDYATYPIQVSMKVDGVYQAFGTAPPCSNPNLINEPTGRGVIATPAAQAAGNCYDVAVSTRNPDTGELTRVILFSEDPRFTPISR